MTSTKLFLAILLNLFVFPGLGQMFLKQKTKGLVIIITITVLLCVIIFHTSYLISHLIADLPFTVDLWALAKNLTTQLLVTHGLLLKSYFWGMVLVYFYAVVDLLCFSLRS